MMENIANIAREMRAQSVSFKDDRDAWLVQQWSDRLLAELRDNTKPGTLTAAQWDFERMKEQRDCAIDELNRAKRQIDEFTSSQKKQNDSYANIG